MNLTQVSTERRTPLPASTLESVAGNVTQLTITGTTVTQAWAGYYGQISGVLTLDNADNKTLYNWSLTHPEGEIYASTAAVDFRESNVFCYNYTEKFAADLSLQEYEASLSISDSDADGVNETFTFGLAHNSFYAGYNAISANSCAAVHLFGGSGAPSEDFQELLLYDNTSKNVVFATLINTDKPGFTGDSYDFEMILAEDGHSGDTTPTTYFFYVELE